MALMLDFWFKAYAKAYFILWLMVNIANKTEISLLWQTSRELTILETHGDYGRLMETQSELYHKVYG